MTHEQQIAIHMAIGALNDARRLWPERHPASGMIVGIDDDCSATYNLITEARDSLRKAFPVPTPDQAEGKSDE